MDNLTLLIGTCDNYSWLWPLYLQQHKKYWRVDGPVVVAGETLTFNEPDLKNVLPGLGVWSNRMRAALDEITTEYSVFILEDYLWAESITEEFLYEQIYIMDKYWAEKIMLDQKYPSDIYHLEQLDENLYKFATSSPYKNSVQPSIWRTEYLKSIMIGGLSPWQFEVEHNDYTTALNPLILLNAMERKYFNLARRGGMLEQGWEQFFQKEGLSLHGT